MKDYEWDYVYLHAGVWVNGSSGWWQDAINPKNKFQQLYIYQTSGNAHFGIYRIKFKIKDFYSLSDDDLTKTTAIEFLIKNDNQDKWQKTCDGNNFSKTIHQFSAAFTPLEKSSFYVGESIGLEFLSKIDGSANDGNSPTVSITQNDNTLSDITASSGAYTKTIIAYLSGHYVVVGQSKSEGGAIRTDTVRFSIIDPLITLTRDNATIYERDGVAATTITASIPAAMSSDITIPLNILGAALTTDYTSAASITIEAGQTTGTVAITAVDNHAKTGDKSLTIAAGNITGGAVTFTCSSVLSVTIVDADASCKLPATPVVPATYVCKGASEATFTVSNSHASTTYSLWDAQNDGDPIIDIYNADNKTINRTFNAPATYYLQADSAAAAAGCQNSARTEVSVIVKQKPNDFTYSVTDVSQAGGNNDGSITLTAGLNGQAPFTLTLTPGGAQETINNLEGTVTFNNLATEIYSVKISGADGCGDTTISNISVAQSSCTTTPATPQINGGAQNICYGTATALQVANVEGNTTYALYNSVNAEVTSNSSGTFNIPTTQAVGSYHIIAKNTALESGCQESTAAVLTIKVTPGDASAEVTQQSSPLTNLGQITVNVGSQGAAPFTVKLMQEADEKSSAVIGETDKSHIFQNLAAGAYSVTVTGNNSCEKTIENLVVENCTAPAAPIATASSICSNSKATIEITDPDASLIYTLYDADIQGNIVPSDYGNGALTTNNNISGNATLYVMATKSSNLEGCQNSARTPVAITVASLTVTLSPTAKTCESNSGTITVTVAGTGGIGGSSFTNYKIQLNNEPPVEQPSGYTFTNLAAGSYTVKVTDNSKGCTDSKSINVTENTTPPTITATSTASQPEQSNGSVVVKITAGSAPFTVSVGGNTQNGVALGTEATFSGLAPDSYTVQATGANGCSSTTTVTVGTDASAVSISPSWAVHEDSLVITLNTAGTGFTGALQSYDNDDVYLWAGVVLSDNSSKYIPAEWAQVPPAKLKMTKTGAHTYRFCISSLKIFYDLSDAELASVAGLKYLFRSGGDGSGNGILEGKNNGSDYWEDLHSFRLNVWIDNQEDRNVNDVYRYYVGESVNLKLEKFVDGNPSNEKKYPVDILLNDAVIHTIPASQTYSNGVHSTTYEFSAAVGSATLCAKGYSTGGAVASTAQNHALKVVPPVASLSLSASIVGACDSVTVTARIPIPAVSAITIPLQVTGGTQSDDYTISNAGIVIAAGDTTATAIIRIPLGSAAASLSVSAGNINGLPGVTFTSGSALTLNISRTLSVQLMNPTDNEIFAYGTAIVINAHAANADTLIIYVDNVEKDRTLNNSLTYTLQNAAEGLHTILAVAATAGGGREEAECSIEVSAPVTPAPTTPTISILQPQNGSVFQSGSNITITAQATNADTLILYVNNVVAQRELSLNLTYVMQATAAGTYNIEAVARTATGNQAQAAVNITVNGAVVDNPAPVAAILHPAHNSGYTEKGSATFIVSLTNADSAVLKFNGAVVHRVGQTDGFSYTITNLTAGTHTIAAEAIRKDGQRHAAQISIAVSRSTSAGKDEGRTALLVYPNPAKDKVYISSEVEDANATIDIYTSDGVLIKQSSASAFSSGITLPQGVYFIRLNAKNVKQAQKLVVK
jgi:hypothetical protein